MSLPQSSCEKSQSNLTVCQTESQRLAKSIDHTKLTFGPNEVETQAILQLCEEARLHGFYAVCVRPRHIALAKEALNGTSIQVATVIGFPVDKVKLSDELAHPTVGAFHTDEKVFETQQSVAAGADELDLVMNVKQLKADLKSGSTYTRTEFQAIRTAAVGKPIKVIIETDLLSPEEVDFATTLCAETGMAMVKTSTGMVSEGKGATLDVVKQISAQLQQLHSLAGIKASGGIKNRQQALAFLELGVQRLGTSSGVAILEGTPVAPEAY